jgi:hypothetical protein
MLSIRGFRTESAIKNESDVFEWIIYFVVSLNLDIMAYRWMV